MTKLGNLLLDDYNLETLVVPAVAIAMPIGIAMAVLGFNISGLLGFAVLGVEIILFPLWLGANSIREAGKTFEKSIFSEGFPTTERLRLRTGSKDYIKQTLRTLIQTKTGVKLFDEPSEVRDSKGADQAIEHAVNTAKEYMRDPGRYKLLRRELKSYGYWRNMVGIRAQGMSTSILGLIGCIISFWLPAADGKHLILSIISSGVCGLMFLFWLKHVGQNKVISAADRYADQFFRSLEILEK